MPNLIDCCANLFQIHLDNLVIPLINQIQRHLKSVDLSKVGIRGLQHSFASLAYHIGMPEKVAMQIGGWADNQTMHKIYTHIAQDEISKQAAAMTQFYQNCCGTMVLMFFIWVRIPLSPPKSSLQLSLQAAFSYILVSFRL